VIISPLVCINAYFSVFAIYILEEKLAAIVGTGVGYALFVTRKSITMAATLGH
jgi:hypothetical protein